MSDMVERVEAVINEKLMATWSSESPLAKAALRQLSTTLAREAIEAMREPTQAMTEAGWGVVIGSLNDNEADIYRAMIDAALKGEAE